MPFFPNSLLRIAKAPEVDKTARLIAERVGLGQVVDRRPGTLPFADLRRMELAKVIARNPKVVLIDEPFAGLTLAEIDTFSALIRALGSEGRAVLLVDHSVKSIAALADRVLAMYLGEPVAEGKASDVMSNETVRRVYLGGGIEATGYRDGALAEAEPLLQIENVRVLYGKAQALDNVRFVVKQRECVSIVGLNGAGKTTLFNTVSGLVPYSGSIHFGDHDLRDMTAGEIARSGVVQCPETRELFGTMSVRENLELGGHLLSQNARAKQLEMLFDLFPILASRQSQAARTLSGGEQQMLAIARALMMQPTLLILDEPTLGLAPVVIEQLSRSLGELRRTTPITILLGEQNVTFALPHADRVYVLDHGRVTWEGGPTKFASEMGLGYL